MFNSTVLIIGLNVLRKGSVNSSEKVLKYVMQKPPGPGLFPIFICLMADLNSSVVKGPSILCACS